jgi:hypothetical protein
VGSGTFTGNLTVADQPNPNWSTLLAGGGSINAPHRALSPDRQSCARFRALPWRLARARPSPSAPTSAPPGTSRLFRTAPASPQAPTATRRITRGV